MSIEVHKTRVWVLFPRWCFSANKRLVLTMSRLSCVYHRRRSAESSSRGYATVLRDLRVWVQGFVGRASEGIFEREALLAR